MREWIKISAVLCTFGFFRELRPSEPFVTEFMSDERWRNVTSDQVNREIYPFGTYSYLVQLCIVFLITDILRYKPIIVASSIVGLVLWSLLLWTSSLFWLYMVQICYGFYMAAEVAYYTYIYAKVSKEEYQRVTGYTRASFLSGRFIGAAIAQILITFKLMDVRQLNYISFGAQAISFPFSLMLPSVGISLYMWSVEPQNSNEHSKGIEKTQRDLMLQSNEPKPTFSFERATKLIWQHFKESYSNRTVLIWSIWWSFCQAGFFLVINYVQLLWGEIDPNLDSFYNGGVEALLTLFGALSATLAGHILNKSFVRYDIYLLTICSFIEGGLILISATTSSIYVSYAMYILFGIFFHFIITLVTAFVARSLSDDSFALIFGINTLLALVIQTIFTVVFVTETASFSFSPREQFVVFGYYFIGLGVIYSIASIVKFLGSKKREM